MLLIMIITSLIPTITIKALSLGCGGRNQSSYSFVLLFACLGCIIPRATGISLDIYPAREHCTCWCMGTCEIAEVDVNQRPASTPSADSGIFSLYCGILVNK